jgi:hypothetical protein
VCGATSHVLQINMSCHGKPRGLNLVSENKQPLSQQKKIEEHIKPTLYMYREPLQNISYMHLLGHQRTICFLFTMFQFFSFSFCFFVLCHTIAIGSWTGRRLECSFVLSPNSVYMKNLHKSSPKIERWVNTRETGRVKSRPVVSVRRAASNFCQRRVGWSAPKTCKQ